jgi:TrmH family RNA methyltransferase
VFKIGDTATEEEVIVESNPIVESTEESKNESKEKSEEKSTAKSTGISTKRGMVLNKNQFSEAATAIRDNVYVVFVECETSGNVGFLARTMANFGLKNLVLINPCKLQGDAYYQAMHAREIVESAEIYDTLDHFLESKGIDFIIGTTGSPGGSYNLSRIPIMPEELGSKINPNNKIALVFGREGDGLSNEEIDKCDIVVSIPTDPSYPVMNITHAAAIIFYEIFKHKNTFAKEGLDESTHVEKEHLLENMKELIDCLSIPEHKKKTGYKTFKNIVNRAFITGRESHTLMGIFRHAKLDILHKKE